MGDVMSLIEQAENAFDEEETRKLEEKIRRNKFDLEDFLGQMRQINKLGGLAKLIDMIPGISAAQKKDINLVIKMADEPVNKLYGNKIKLDFTKMGKKSDKESSPKVEEVKEEIKAVPDTEPIEDVVEEAAAETEEVVETEDVVEEAAAETEDVAGEVKEEVVKEKPKKVAKKETKKEEKEEKPAKKVD